MNRTLQSRKLAGTPSKRGKGCFDGFSMGGIIMSPVGGVGSDEIEANRADVGVDGGVLGAC